MELALHPTAMDHKGQAGNHMWQKPTNTDNVFRLKIWNHTLGLSPEKSKEPLFSLSLYSVSTAFKFHGSMSESFCIISCSFITGNLK